MRFRGSAAVRRMVLVATTAVAMLALTAAAAPAHVVSGAVRTEAGMPVSGVDVSVQREDSGATVAETATGLDGRYSVAVASGTYQLTFTPPATSGYDPVVFRGLAVSADRTLDVALSRAGFLVTGIVRDGDGAPVADVTVLAEGTSASDISDGSGRYELRLPTGTYDLVARKWGGSPAPIEDETRQEAVMVNGDVTQDIAFVGWPRLAGEVLTAAGAPVAGVDLSIRASTETHQARTGADGRFTLPRVPPNEAYGLRLSGCEATYPSTSPAWPDVTLRDACTRGEVPVPLTGLGDHELSLRLPAPRPVTVTVIGPDGEPLADAAFALNNGVDEFAFAPGHTATAETDAVAITGADGTATVNLAGRRAEASLQVVPASSEDIPQMTFRVDGTADAVTADYAALGTLHRLTGQVLDGDGAPVPDVRVRVDGFDISDYTAADGSYELRVPTGAHDLILHKGNSDAPVEDTVTIRDVFVDGDTERTLRFEGWPKLTGRVVTADGGPVEASLDLSGPDGNPRVRTDAAGEFAFPRVRPEDWYTLRVSGCERTRTTDSPEWAEIPLQDGCFNAGMPAGPLGLGTIDVTLVGPAAREIDVEVRGPDGAPLADAAFLLENAVPGHVFAERFGAVDVQTQGVAVTGADGRASVRVAGTRAVTSLTVVPGAASGIPSHTFTVDGTAGSVVADYATIGRLHRLSGTVRDGDGQPIADAQVVVDGRSESAWSDGSGRYALHLPTGAYDLTVRGPQDVPVEPEVHVEGVFVGADTERDVAFRGWPRLTGTLLHGTGAPAAGMRLVLVDPNGHDQVQAQTDADGRFAFPRVAPGLDRTLRISGCRLAGEYGDACVDSGTLSVPDLDLGTTDVTLALPADSALTIHVQGRESEPLAGVLAGVIDQVLNVELAEGFTGELSTRGTGRTGADGSVTVNLIRGGGSATGFVFPNGVNQPHREFVVAAGATEALVSLQDATGDREPPAVDCEQPAGWHAGDVTVECTATDAGVGLADAADERFTLTTAVPDGTADAAAQTNSRSVCDRAGNCTEARVTGLRVDRARPVVDILVPQAGQLVEGGAPPAADFACADPEGGSGLASCDGTVADGAPLDVSARGERTLVVTARDAAGNTAELTVPYTVTAKDEAAGEAAPGEPVATNATTSPADPTGTAVEPPAPGTVTIAEGPVTADDPEGYTFVGQQVRIEAPPASAEEPLRLSFRLDASVLPQGTDAGSVVVYRDGVPIDTCADTSGTATPDPCVSSRETAADGDALLTVLTSHASDWNFAADTTPPVVTCGSAAAAWLAANAEIACTAGDLGTGLAAAADAAFVLTTDVARGEETADAATGTREVCDRSGNCVTAGPVTGNRVDRRPPDVSVLAPAQGATYGALDRTPADYACTDGGSGVAQCSGPVADGSPFVRPGRLGPQTFTVTARDRAGNQTQVTRSYRVTLLGSGIGGVL